MQSIATLLPKALPKALQPADDTSRSTNSVIVIVPSEIDTTSRRSARALRFRQILNNLAMARGITLNQAEEDWFLSRLHSDGWNSDQADKAELWLVRGDWRFRGTRPRIEYSDFWPGTEILKSLAESEDFTLITVAEKSRLTRLADRGRARVGLSDKNAASEALGGDSAKVNALVVQLNGERMDLMVRVEELESENRMLTREVEVLERKLGRIMEPDGGIA